MFVSTSKAGMQSGRRGRNLRARPGRSGIGRRHGRFTTVALSCGVRAVDYTNPSPRAAVVAAALVQVVVAVLAAGVCAEH